MANIPLWRRYLRFWRPNVQADIDDELRFHFEERAADLRARGLPPDAIASTIAEEFGDVEVARRRLHEIDQRVERRRERLRWWHELRADLGYALRGIRRHPTFAVTAVLTIALGIGAVTLMLTAARAAFVGLMPFPNADQLVMVWERRTHDPSARGTVSYADLLDWRADDAVFAALEGYDETNVTLTGVDEPVRLEGARVTPGLLAMLGARSVLGRTFSAAGDAAKGAAPVVVVSHQFWQRHLGGDPSAPGRTLTLDGRTFTVIGVLGRDFRFVPVGDADVWLPIDGAAALSQDRSDRWLRIVARLRAGVTPQRASAELATRMRQLAERYPADAGLTAGVVPLRDEILGPIRPLLLALSAAVALLLLVSCANVASLFLARALTRGRELAMRVALGAGRGRIVRQLLTESVLVAALGGMMGIVLAWVGVGWLAIAAPRYVAGRLPFLHTMKLDHEVLFGAISVALACGVAFGIAPALQAARNSFAGLGRREGGGSDSRARRALLVGQVAFTTVLLVGAGLMTRSVQALLRVDPGFATEQVVTMRLALAGPRYEEPAVQQRFFETMVARVRELSGVRAVGAVSQVPLSGGGSTSFRVEGEPETGRAMHPAAMRRAVAGDYFRAMGIRVIEGRALESRDDSSAPRVIAISEDLARRLFGSESALGRRLRLNTQPDTPWTIVGVVSDVRATSLDAPPTPTIYIPHLQSAENRMSVVVRAAGDPASLLSTMQREVHAVDPLLPIYQSGTMAEQVASTPAVFLRRALLLLFGGFALVATVLAAVGLYGVQAYQVAQRTRELGIRSALGATQRAVVTLVLRQGAVLTLLGIATGLAVSLVLGRGMGALLYGVRPADLITYVAVALLLVGVALLASLVPARRAASVSPTEALHADQ